MWRVLSFVGFGGNAIRVCVWFFFVSVRTEQNYEFAKDRMEGLLGTWLTLGCQPASASSQEKGVVRQKVTLLCFSFSSLSSFYLSSVPPCPSACFLFLSVCLSAELLFLSLSSHQRAELSLNHSFYFPFSSS